MLKIPGVKREDLQFRFTLESQDQRLLQGIDFRNCGRAEIYENLRPRTKGAEIVSVYIHNSLNVPSDITRASKRIFGKTLEIEELNVPRRQDKPRAKLRLGAARDLAKLSKKWGKTFSNTAHIWFQTKCLSYFLIESGRDDATWRSCINEWENSRGMAIFRVSNGDLVMVTEVTDENRFTLSFNPKDHTKRDEGEPFICVMFHNDDMVDQTEALWRRIEKSEDLKARAITHDGNIMKERLKAWCEPAEGLPKLTEVAHGYQEGFPRIGAPHKSYDEYFKDTYVGKTWNEYLKNRLSEYETKFFVISKVTDEFYWPKANNGEKNKAIPRPSHIKARLTINSLGMIVEFITTKRKRKELLTKVAGKTQLFTTIILHDDPRIRSQSGQIPHTNRWKIANERQRTGEGVNENTVCTASAELNANNLEAYKIFFRITHGRTIEHPTNGELPTTSVKALEIRSFNMKDGPETQYVSENYEKGGVLPMRHSLNDEKGNGLKLSIYYHNYQNIKNFK